MTDSTSKKRSLPSRVVRRLRRLRNKLVLRFRAPFLRAALEPHGAVEVLNEREVFGWLELPEDEEARELTLYVNETPIATTTTAALVSRDVPYPVAQFRLRLNSLWDYVGFTDVLSVRYAGRALSIRGRGPFAAPPKSGWRRLSTLKKRFEAGYVFNQKGKLQLSKALDADWQRAVFDLYDRLRIFLRDRFDLELMVVYGTLLGAVRSGRFITRDHDFDVGYFSKETTPDRVKAEARSLILALAGAGYDVEVKLSCFYVSDKASGGTQIDFGRLFFDDDDVLQSGFGFAGTTAFRRSDFRGYRDIELQGHSVRTVDNPDALLACIYGDGWRTPNPGFQWEKDKKTACPAARFNRDEIQALYEEIATLRR